MKPTDKAKEIADNAKLPLSLNETDEVLRAINICGKKGHFKTAVKYGALVMHDWTKQQVLEEAIKLTQQWILEHDYVDIMELEDYIKEQMEE